LCGGCDTNNFELFESDCATILDQTSSRVTLSDGGPTGILSVDISQGGSTAFPEVVCLRKTTLGNKMDHKLINVNIDLCGNEDVTIANDPVTLGPYPIGTGIERHLFGISSTDEFYCPVTTVGVF